jgi:hypothetical protein
MHGNKMDELPVKLEDVTVSSRAKTRRTLCDEVKYWLDVGRRARDDAEHFRCRDQLFKRLVTLMCESRDF